MNPLKEDSIKTGTNPKRNALKNTKLTTPKKMLTLDMTELSATVK